MAKKKDTTEGRIVAVEEALSKTEQFIEKNQKMLTIIVAAIILVVVVVIGIRKFYIQPKEKNAASAMFMAERYFEKDSFNLALKGDGYYLGFLDIIDDYGITSSGNLACYYTGICYLNLGDDENAIKYLKKFNGKDKMISSVAIGSIGDAYTNMGELDKGAKYYQDAANNNPNELISPSYLLKAAWLHEMLNEWDDALDMYEKIKEEFTKSREAGEMDKYIARAKIKLDKE